MKILMINKADRVGGAAEIAWDLKEGLMQRGHAVDFLVSAKTASDDHVRQIPRSRAGFLMSHVLGTDIDGFNTDYILDTPEFAAADIIHCHNLHGHYFNLRTLIKMSQVKPVVWTLHDLWAVTPYCSQAPNKKLTAGFYSCPISSSKSIMKYFNQAYLRQRKQNLYKNLQVNLAVPSLWLKNKLAGSILAGQPQALIHHGIDTVIFQAGDKAVARQNLNLPADKKIVLFVASGGASNIWKGWPYAKQAITYFKNRPDVLFLCIGGRGKSGLPNLQFIDYISDKALLAKYFQAADAFLLASTAESFALVVLEAMACGLPVVSFSVGIVPEVIKHQDNGYIAKYLDGVDLARGLSEVLNFSPAKMKQLAGTNQTVLSPEFTLAKMIDKYEELYRSLLN